MKIVLVSLFLVWAAHADNKYNFYGELFLGPNVLGAQDFTQQNVASLNSTGEFSADLGYRAGFAFGYYLSDKWSLELTWDYLTNQGSTRFSDGTNFADGDYSSRLHFLNGHYHFNEIAPSFRPYIGVGVGIIQEIDIDLENAAGENSYSDEGGIGYQISVGMAYQVNNNWQLNTEITNIEFPGPDFKSEGGNGVINDQEAYSPWSLNLGIRYIFD